MLVVTGVSCGILTCIKPIHTNDCSIQFYTIKTNNAYHSIVNNSRAITYIPLRQGKIPPVEVLVTRRTFVLGVLRVMSISERSSSEGVDRGCTSF